MRIGLVWGVGLIALLPLATGCDRFLAFSPGSPRSSEARVDSRGDGPADAPLPVDRARSDAPAERPSLHEAAIPDRPLQLDRSLAPDSPGPDKVAAASDKLPPKPDLPGAVDKQGSKTDKPSSPSIVITEMMVNPNGNDPTGEWFELHNPGTAVVNLQGWTVSDEQGSFPIGSLLVNPGAYAVIGAGQADVSADFTYTNTSYNTQVCMPNDTPDRLELKDPSGKQVDLVAYTTSWPYLPGASMSLKSVGLDNSNPANWCTETTEYAGGKNKNKGTPGAAAGCGP